MKTIRILLLGIFFVGIVIQTEAQVEDSVEDRLVYYLVEFATDGKKAEFLSLYNSISENLTDSRKSDLTLQTSAVESDFFVTFMIYNGSDINAIIDGQGVLNYLSRLDFEAALDRLKTLKDYGFKLNESSITRALPEIFSARNYNLIEWFLRSDAFDVAATDDEGNTALHIAVQMRNEEAVKYMLLKGANVDAANLNGVTPEGMLDKIIDSPDDPVFEVVDDGDVKKRIRSLLDSRRKK